MIFRFSVLSLGVLLLQTGCGILFGNVKRDISKASSYRIDRLSNTDPAHWRKLDSKEVGQNENTRDAGEGEISDLVFQSIQTDTVVSVNSTCDESIEEDSRNLSEISRLLLLGIRQSTPGAQQTAPIEENLILDGQPALGTVLEGQQGNQTVKIKAVVTKKENCNFDFLFVSRPENFASDLPAFDRMVASFRFP